MNKRIFYFDREIYIGDILNIDGIFNVKITEDLIKLNPELFTILEYNLNYFEQIAKVRGYGILKKLNSRLYYTQVLYIIADEFNRGIEPGLKDSKYLIGMTSRDGGTLDIVSHQTVKYTAPYFLNKQHARQAINIMGNKIYNIIEW